MYCIKDGYISREGALQDCENEQRMKDEWQNEVYACAWELAWERGYQSVLDLGTGSGFKLMKYFSSFETLGVELPANVDFLARTYPNRRWSEFCRGPMEQFDLVICADAIEHVDNPDTIIGFIQAAEPKVVVLSTPDRALLRCGQDGPPANTKHVREWTFAEFENYVSHYFKIEQHFHSNKKQATQCVVCA